MHVQSVQRPPFTQPNLGLFGPDSSAGLTLTHRCANISGWQLELVYSEIFSEWPKTQYWQDKKNKDLEDTSHSYLVTH